MSNAGGPSYPQDPPPGQGYPPPGQGYPPPPPGSTPSSYPPPPGPAGYPPPGQGYPPPGQGGYGYPGYPGGYGESQAPAGYSGLAIASFVTGLILPLVGILVAVPLGIVALVKISGTRKKGRWMAIAGIVLSVLWWVAIITFGVILAAQQAERDSSGAISKAGRIDFGDIRAKDCVTIPNLADNAEVDTFDIKGVPCDEAHNAETVAVLPISGSAYPGQAELDNQSSQQCVSAVEQVPGVSTDYRPYVLLPNKDIWDGTDGHRVLCFVVDSSFGDLTGSLQE